MYCDFPYYNSKTIETTVTKFGAYGEPEIPRCGYEFGSKST